MFEGIPTKPSNACRMAHAPDDFPRIRDRSTPEHDATRMRDREFQLSAIVNQSPSALSLKTPDGHYALANPNLQKILHLPEAQIVGKTDAELFPEETACAFRANDAMVLRSGARHSIEEWIPVNGVPRLFMSHMFPVPDEQGVVRFICRISLDITDRKLAEQRAIEAALHDPLTGLPNRTLAFEYGNHLIASTRRGRKGGALLFVDIDRFKPINDLHGHATGDRVLQEVARRLKVCTRKEDLVARLGGDEFVILLSQLPATEYRGVAVAQHLLEALARPFRIGSLELQVTPSIGISWYPEHGDNLDSLIRAADLAMYQAKQAGRSNVRTYTRDLERQAEKSLSIEMQLKRALTQGGLVLHYQPVVDIHSGQLVAAEALLRMRGADGGLISPQHLIPVAEATGLIGEIGAWVATEACRQMREWSTQGLPPVSVAVNVSPIQFRQRGFRQRLLRIVEAAAIDPACLQLEVTESTVMENVDEVIDALKDIKSLGVRIALDDFGTGYSSLGLLTSLPLDKIKIDQSFVRRIESEESSVAVTRAIIALGSSLKLQVVGEGIENEAALNHLRAIGCDQAQGYLISRPLPADDFVDWWRLQAANCATVRPHLSAH